MEKIVIRRTSRLLHGHCWIFSNELAVSPKTYEPGSLVEVYDHHQVFMGIGYINPASLIVTRLLTREQEAIDAAFFRKRLLGALAYRKQLGIEDDSCRLIFSEGDMLPGLIADKYGRCLVLQFLTLGMERLRDLVLQVFDDCLKPDCIVLRNDSHVRTLEGLPLYTELVKGTINPFPVIREGSLGFEIDPIAGQKTGFFLDQRDNRTAFASIAQGGTALDLFCYSGAWGLHLARKGAEVTFVDSSDRAMEQARGNVIRNNLEDRCSFVKADAFDLLRDLAGQSKTFDTVVLDPPAFVKSRLKINEALRGYREINAMALKIVRKGGILATSSCSYHIDRVTFLEMLRDSAFDARRSCRLIACRSQSKDHPIHLSVPETEYLKCAFLEVC